MKRRLNRISSFSPTHATTKILFEPTGQKLPQVIGLNEKSKSWEVAIGPEGGFTDAELEILTKKSFISCSLTPTILRSIDAVTVGLGCMRSILTEN